MPKKFTFRSNQIIGAASAEADGHYLDQCFIDTGDLDIIKNCSDPRLILIGRTGCGKSALFRRLPQVEDHVIKILPESLALTYIANSNILKFFTEAGVNLDIFFRLLWRHIICVEVLKARFYIIDEEKKRNFLELIWSIIPKNKQNEKALDYLKKWGESFWLDTEYRVQEITQKFEQDLSASIEGKVPNIASLNGRAAKKLSEEQKQEIIHRAQEIVNHVQIRELSTVMDLMNDVLLTDSQQKFFITIDKLDEDWIEDYLRFRLIRALIETSMDFFDRVNNVKVLIALRSDLLDRIYRYTRDAGFQEEKFRTSNLEISWTKDQLIQVLNTRIDLLVKNQYTKDVVTYKDVLPEKVGNQFSIDYMLERTLMRPRDIIQFFNACITHSDGKPTISRRSLIQAEGTYSRERLRALFDEWYGLYPNLNHLYLLLRGKGSVFIVESLTDVELTENYLQLLTSKLGSSGQDLEMMKMVFEGQMELASYRRNIVNIFYKTSLVGLRTEHGVAISWSYKGGQSISISEIVDTTRMYIHPMFQRVLGIYDGNEESEQ